MLASAWVPPRAAAILVATVVTSSFCVNQAFLVTESLARAPVPQPQVQLQWTDVLDLGVGGRGFPENSGNLTFARFPAAAQAGLTPAEWDASLNSAGLFLQFASNASSIHLSYVLRDANQTRYSAFPPTGASGMDLYRWDETIDTWRWVATTYEGLQAAGDRGSPDVLESPLFTDTAGWPIGPLPPFNVLNATYRYRLHFPSFNGVLSASVGVPLGASLSPDHSWNASGVHPVLYLGTASAQGAFTARPGTTFVNRLSRSLTVSALNLGLAGSCALELGLAQWVGRISASVLVIDCGWDMTPELVAANVVPFVRAVRAEERQRRCSARVGTSGNSAANNPASLVPMPIVLVEPTDFRPSWLLDALYNITGVQAELRAAFAALVAGGDNALTYVPAGTLYAGEDGPTEELSFEGVHPMDRGHALMAQALAEVLQPLVDDDARLPVSMRATLTGADEWEPEAPLPYLRHAAAAAVPVADLAATASPIQWTDAATLTIRGRAFNDTPSPWNRLPTAAEGVVRSDVWYLSLYSAGITVSFESDSPVIWVDYTALEAFVPEPHFSVTGVSGLDLYAWDDATQQYRFVATADLPFNQTRWLAPLTPLAANVTQPGVPLRWLLYACTYNSVVSLSIGTVTGSSIKPDDPYLPHRIERAADASRVLPPLPINSAARTQLGAAASQVPAAAPAPICWYGTSILQGGVAFKPGNIITARVGRALQREILNFGFSGNGEMELSVAQFLTAISPAPAAFIVDCSWNMNATSISSNAVPLVQYLREHGHPATPIVLAEGLPFGRAWAVPDQAAQQAASNAALAAAYQQLIGAGDQHLYYVSSDQLFGPLASVDSATANGLHPTDAGMHDMAALWISLLLGLLG